MKPQWYTLKSKRGDAQKKKGNEVSGEIQLQFKLVDNANPSASELDVFNKFRAFTSGTPSEEGDEPSLSQLNSQDGAADDDDDDDDEQGSDETDDPTKPETAEKRKKRLRIKALKRKTKAQAYELSGGSDWVGMVFLEINKLTDLPPERNGSYLSASVPLLDLTYRSHSNDVRHGSVRGCFARTEDLSYPGNSP